MCLIQLQPSRGASLLRERGFFFCRHARACAMPVRRSPAIVESRCKYGSSLVRNAVIFARTCPPSRAVTLAPRFSLAGRKCRRRVTLIYVVASSAFCAVF